VEVNILVYGRDSFADMVMKMKCPNQGNMGCCVPRKKMSSTTMEKKPYVLVEKGKVLYTITK
jgi:hypothetical protein